MKYFLRIINIILLVLVLWQFTTLASTVAAPLKTTPPTPFLYNPFYGTGVTILNSFDHQYPTYDKNGSFMYRDGTITLAANCKYDGTSDKKCYDGHSGIDYQLVHDDILGNVVAAAQGTVTYAGWAAVDHESSFGLMIEIDHANNYRTIYGHLSSIIYQTGDQVRPDSRWNGYPYFKTVYPQIGTTGTTGNSTTDHLHFDVRYLLNGTWKATDPYGWQGTQGKDPWEVDKDGQGNLIGGIKSVNLWVASPVQPYRPIDGPLVFDDNSSIFSVGCKTPMTCNWRTQPTGGYNGGNFHWTSTTNSSSYNYFAQWQPPVPIMTEYEIQVYIPSWEPTNRTNAARYEIKHAYGTKVVIVDQHRVGYKNVNNTITYAPQWVSLGHYFFNKGSSNYVRVTDSTYGVCNKWSQCSPFYDEGNGAKKLLVDAMRAYAN